ncbi:MAG: TIM barrel protein [Verrucomicrobia bacterium]|nr:TIM barrel protein [Verrucomicrobiota bacterium]
MPKMAMNIKVGSAPDAWGVWFPNHPKQTPWQRFLDEVAEAGYEWIELGPYGYLPTDLYTDLFTGEKKGPDRLKNSDWKRLIDATHKVADLARDRFGLGLVFHPHAETHVEYEDQIEAFLEQTDPERVSLCLDTGHHAYRGSDPVAFMQRHRARIPYLHLKNIDPEVQKKVETEKPPFVTAVEMEMFCEPDRGTVNFLILRDVLRKTDFDGWAIVEHDMHLPPLDKPLPIAKRTRAYLREIGIG